MLFKDSLSKREPFQILRLLSENYFVVGVGGFDIVVLLSWYNIRREYHCLWQLRLDIKPYVVKIWLHYTVTIIQAIKRMPVSVQVEEVGL